MASRGVNKVILIGNLGAKPEIRYTNEGKAITTVNVATSETRKDRQTGEPIEQTEWHRVVLFDKLAEIAGQYLQTGSKVYVEGRIRYKKWTDKNNQERFTTKITADNFQMLDSRRSSGEAPRTDMPSEMSPATEEDDLPF